MAYILEQIAELPYYNPRAASEQLSARVVSLFAQVFPDLNEQLCKTCKTDIDYRYRKLKSYLKENSTMSDKAKFRYRFADDNTLFEVPYEAVHYTNANLTDEIAEYLIEKYPHIQNFLVIDESVDAPAKKATKKEALALTGIKTELDLKAEESKKATKKKAEKPEETAPEENEPKGDSEGEGSNEGGDDEGTGENAGENPTA